MTRGQGRIEGSWVTEDHSRTYMFVQLPSGEYEGRLLHRTRDSLLKEEPCIRHLRYEERKNQYRGVFVSPVDPTLATEVRLRVSADGQVLSLELQRMLFMHVHKTWYRTTVELQGNPDGLTRQGSDAEE